MVASQIPWKHKGICDLVPAAAAAAAEGSWIDPSHKCRACGVGSHKVSALPEESSVVSRHWSVVKKLVRENGPRRYQLDAWAIRGM
jgi:hypothetical protein